MWTDMWSLFCALLLVQCAVAFQPSALPSLASKVPSKAVARKTLPVSMKFDPMNLYEDEVDESDDALAAIPAAALASLAFLPQAAHAKGGQYGLFEGRTASMLHPTFMAALFFVSLSAGFTGLQWRRLRTIGTEISDLKAEIKGPEKQIKSLKAVEEPDTAAIATLESSIAPHLAKIAELTETRKELAAAGFRDQHWTWGSILLGAGVFFAIEGPANTYARASKLFPGPHLYYGAVLPILWAVAAALVPAMQKGNNAARYGHIGLNFVSVALFASQIPTGWEITQKVIKFTQFP